MVTEAGKGGRGRMFAREKIITLGNKTMPYLVYSMIMMHEGGIIELVDNCIYR